MPLVDLTAAVVLLLKVAVTGWLAAIAVIDHRFGRVPNTLTRPVIVVVGLLQLGLALRGQPERFGLLAAWVLIFLLWMARFLGGGDAKFLMALYALFPSMEFTAVLALILLLLIIPLVIREYWGRSPGPILRAAWRRLATGQVLPSHEELTERGKRYAWTYAVPALIYTWLYWDVGPGSWLG